MTALLTLEELRQAYAGKPVAELETAYNTTVVEVQDIQAQLSNKNRTDANGQRLSEYAWHNWRGKAVSALRHKLQKQRLLKQLLTDARRRFNTTTPLKPVSEFRTPEDLIHAALVVLRRISGETEMEADEYAVMDALDSWLRTHGRVGT